MKYLSIILILFLSSCISSPEVVKRQNGNEANLSCSALFNELETAKQYKILAREEDKFMLKHMNPVTTMISVVNMNRAESAAEDRINLLNKVIANKKCIQNNVNRLNINQPYMTNYSNDINNNYIPKFDDKMDIPVPSFDDFQNNMLDAPSYNSNYSNSIPKRRRPVENQHYDNFGNNNHNILNNQNNNYITVPNQNDNIANIPSHLNSIYPGRVDKNSSYSQWQ